MKEVLQKRLKNHIKKEKLTQAKLEQEKRMNELHFYCVIDFEGTCEEENPKDYVHEIIEFPTVLVDATTLEVVSVLLQFIAKKLNETLSCACAIFVPHPHWHIPRPFQCCFHTSTKSKRFGNNIEWGMAIVRPICA